MFGFFRIRTIAPDFRDLDNDFGLSLGDGVDVRTSEHVAIRVGQADYIRSHLTHGKITGGFLQVWYSHTDVFTLHVAHVAATL